MMINEKESSWDLILMHQGQRQSVLQWAAQGEASCLCVEILNCGFICLAQGNSVISMTWEGRTDSKQLKRNEESQSKNINIKKIQKNTEKYIFVN